MTPDIYSRPAFLAETAFLSSGLPLKKGQIRELIAAVHGYRSLAAMQAEEPLHGPIEPRHTLVLIDKPSALLRSADLLPDHDADRIVGTLIEVLQRHATPKHFYLRHRADLPDALITLGRICALADPAMAGVVDDLEERVDASIKQWRPSGVGSGYPGEEILRKMQANGGPVRILENRVDDHVAGLLVRLSGTYEDAANESGVIDVHVVFKQRTDHIFNRLTAGSLFTPGRDHWMDMDDHIPGLVGQ